MEKRKMLVREWKILNYRNHRRFGITPMKSMKSIFGGIKKWKSLYMRQTCSYRSNYYKNEETPGIIHINTENICKDVFKEQGLYMIETSRQNTEQV